MAEKNILAYFHAPDEAEAVQRKLQALRALDVSVDRISRYPGAGNGQILNPITGDFAGLGNLTLDADYSDRGAGILSAADVSASGMSDGGQGEPTGRDILLTAVVDESVYEQACHVIREAGGEI